MDVDITTKEENKPNFDKKSKKSLRLILGLIGLLIIVLLIIIFNSKNTEMPTNDDIDNNKILEEISTEPIKTFGYILPEDWHLTEKAEKGIATLAEGQIINYGIIQDPIDSDIVYFSASVFEDDTEEVLISVYKYDTDNYNFERLFRRSYSKNENILHSGELPEFHILGYDNGDLVIYVSVFGEKLDNCINPLIIGSNSMQTMVSMDIENPYNNLDHYTVDDEILIQHKQALKNCE